MGLIKEVTYGTDPGTKLYSWPHVITSFPNPTEDYGRTMVRSLGSGRLYGMTYDTKAEFAFTVESLVNDDGAVSLLAAALGAGAIAPADTLVLGDLESFTIETGLSNSSDLSYELYKGCKVNTLSLEASENEPLKITVDWIAQQMTRATSQVTRSSGSGVGAVGDLVDPSAVPKQMGDITITVKPITNGVVGSALTGLVMRNFTLEIANNLERIYSLGGTKFLGSLMEQGMDITGSFALLSQNDTFANRFAADGANNGVQLEIVIADIGKAAAEDVKIVLPKCRLLSRDFAKDVTDAGPIEESYDFHCQSAPTVTMNE
jgi:hypothetical protein